MIEWVGSCAYKLDIPTKWTIHPVINIAMLEPVPSQKDPFERPTPDHPPAVDNERNNNNRAYYTVARIVGRQARQYSRAKDKTIRYAVIWKGYEN